MNRTRKDVTTAKNEQKDKQLTRKRRSVPSQTDNDLLHINIIINTVNIAFLCIFTIVIAGYLAKKDRNYSRKIKQCQEIVTELIKEKHMYITARVNEFHTQRSELTARHHMELKDKFDMLVTIFQDICKAHRTNTPYPIRLTKGHSNEDFATVRITHWNGQWRDDNNTSLSPSCFLQCPQDLPKPQNLREWQRLARIFYEESGTCILVPHISELEENSYAPTIDISHLAVDQLCRTPVCIRPDVEYEGKEAKCQYCTRVCCNCMNCNRFRGFFKIRTALINTEKVDCWDHYNEELIKSVNQPATQRKDKKTLMEVMKALFQQAKSKQPNLPPSINHLEDDDPLKEKLRNIGLRMLDGPVMKIITADERINRLADDLNNAVLQHFLEDKKMRNDKTEAVIHWLLEEYHQEEEFTKGGSDVTVNFDCNMNEPTTSEEATVDCDSQNNEAVWLDPNTSEEDNVSAENDYASISQ